MQKSKLPEERLKNWKLHDSIRGWFGRALYEEMANNDKIYLITADLGFGLFNAHQDDFPDRFYNVGAAEMCAVGTAIGLALSGKIPFVYSISSFLIYRAFEFIRNYINHEFIPVRLIGSGYERDYKHDGITHQPFGLQSLLENEFPNIDTYWPDMKETVPICVHAMVAQDRPSFICLRR